jgi:hypothetical protein
MLRSSNPTGESIPLLEDMLDVIRKNLAKAIVGSTVDRLADSRTVAHVIVTGVRMVTGAPKILVSGRMYDLNQMVTATAV